MQYHRFLQIYNRTFGASMLPWTPTVCTQYQNHELWYVAFPYQERQQHYDGPKTSRKHRYCILNPETSPWFFSEVVIYEHMTTLTWPSGDSIYLDEIGSCLSQHGDMGGVVDFGGVLILWIGQFWQRSDERSFLAAFAECGQCKAALLHLKIEHLWICKWWLNGREGCSIK